MRTTSAERQRRRLALQFDVKRAGLAGHQTAVVARPVRRLDLEKFRRNERGDLVPFDVDGARGACRQLQAPEPQPLDLAVQPVAVLEHHQVGVGRQGREGRRRKTCRRQRHPGDPGEARADRARAPRASSRACYHRSSGLVVSWRRRSRELQAQPWGGAPAPERTTEREATTSDRPAPHVLGSAVLFVRGARDGRGAAQAGTRLPAWPHAWHRPRRGARGPHRHRVGHDGAHRHRLLHRVRDGAVQRHRVFPEARDLARQVGRDYPRDRPVHGDVRVPRSGQSPGSTGTGRA